MDLIRTHHDPDFRGIDISQKAILPGRYELRHDKYESSKHDELDWQRIVIVIKSENLLNLPTNR
jgi:hypothetical protein